MWLRVTAGLDELNEPSFTPLKLGIGQPSPKQFVAQPDALRVDDIGLAVLADLANPGIPIIFLYVGTAMPSGFPGSPITRHISCRVALPWVAQINCVFGVSVEVWPQCQARQRRGPWRDTEGQEGRTTTR